MHRTATGLGTAALLSCGLMGSCVSPTWAQVQGPYATYGQAYQNYGYDPYGGYLRGAAEVIRAQGQFLVQEQDTYLKYQEFRSAKIEVRRKQLEQWLWERDNLPTLEDERRRFITQQERRAYYAPPLPEIWSGMALNYLLRRAQVLQNNARGDSPLEEELLASINVTSGKDSGNIGLLRGGKVTWPLLLRREAFASDCQQIDALVARACKQAEEQNQIDAGVMDALIRGVDSLKKQLSSRARALEFTEYKDASNTLKQLDEAIRGLQQKDGIDFLTGKVAAKGKTVGELVANMRKDGLQFAPATGGERHYTALHRALAEYVGEEAGSPEKARK